jgi:lipid-A-disaccharide synthase-like uncharacterized protein
MQNPIWFVGALGIVAIEASYVPQIVRLWRRGQAHDMSIFFPGLNVLGRILAVTYAIMKHEPVFSVGFLFGILVRGSLLVQVGSLKLKEHRIRTFRAAAPPEPGEKSASEALFTPTSEVS